MVTILWIAHASSTPLIDLTFRQVDAASVMIESRWGGLVTGRSDAERIDRRVWSVAQQCTGGRLELTQAVLR